MAYPGACGDAANARCGEHGGRVALVFLLLLRLVRVCGRARRCVVVVPAVAVSVAEETALVVARACYVRSVGARRSIRAGGQVGRRIPLSASCGLLNVAALRKLVSICVLEAILTTNAGCSGPTAGSSLVALVVEHHTVREAPGVLEALRCIAEAGSLGHSLGAADRSPEEDRRIAVVADHTAAEAVDHTVAEGDQVAHRCGCCCSSHQRDHDRQAQHLRVLRKSHCGMAARAAARTLSFVQKLFLVSIHVRKLTSGLVLGLVVIIKQLLHLLFEKVHIGDVIRDTCQRDTLFR